MKPATENNHLGLCSHQGWEELSEAHRVAAVEVGWTGLEAWDAEMLENERPNDDHPCHSMFQAGTYLPHSLCPLIAGAQLRVRKLDVVAQIYSNTMNSTTHL